MTELTHHDADDFHEIQLSGKQLVFLFMATTILGVMIFLLGVKVGRNVPATRPSDAGDPVAATSPATATPAAPVTGSTVQKASPSSETPPTIDETDHNDLENGKPNDKLTARKDVPAAPAPQPKAAAPKAAEPPAPKPAPVTAAATPPPAATPPAAATTGTARPGNWVLQVVALKDRSAAQALVQRLAGKGYPAFLVNPASGAPPIYRVQVGRYADKREAQQAADRLQKEEQFRPWIDHAR